MGLDIMEALTQTTQAIAKKIPNQIEVSNNHLYLARDKQILSAGVTLPCIIEISDESEATDSTHLYEMDGEIYILKKDITPLVVEGEAPPIPLPCALSTVEEINAEIEKHGWDTDENLFNGDCEFIALFDLVNVNYTGEDTSPFAVGVLDRICLVKDYKGNGYLNNPYTMSSGTTWSLEQWLNGEVDLVEYFAGYNWANGTLPNYEMYIRNITPFGKILLEEVERQFLRFYAEDEIYNKLEIDEKLASEIYTKKETDTLLSAKVNSDSVYNKSRINSLLDKKLDKSTAALDFANVLKGTASGTIVAVDDFSPIKHELGVKVESKNLFTTEYYIKQYNTTNNKPVFEQSNSFSFTSNTSGTGQCSVTFKIYLEKGDYYLSGDDVVISDSTLSGGYSVMTKDDKTFIVNRSKSNTIGSTISIPADDYYDFHFYGDYNADLGVIYTFSNIQLEKGSVKTEFTPFFDVEGETLNVYGKNLFDEQLEIGTIGTTAGANNDSVTNQLRSKNYIKVLPNTDYYVVCPNNLASTGGLIQIYRYDADKNFLGYGSSGVNSGNFYIQSNWHYIRFVIKKEYGTVYNNDILFALGSTPVEYEPYHCNTYPINADGTVNGVTSQASTFMADTDGVVINLEYNRDVNKAFAELTQAIINLGGTI